MSCFVAQAGLVLLTPFYWDYKYAVQSRAEPGFHLCFFLPSTSKVPLCLASKIRQVHIFASYGGSCIPLAQLWLDLLNPDFSAEHNKMRKETAAEQTAP